MCARVCVHGHLCMHVLQWSLTLLCPDTPDEYLQDIGGTVWRKHRQAFGQAAVCVCVGGVECEHPGKRAGRQSALSKQVTPEGCFAPEL